MGGDSKVAFTATLKELGLDKLKDQFEKNGWDTFVNFAFSTSDPKGADPAAFQKEVVDVLLGTDPGEGNKPLIPRLRRLYAQSYMFASKMMSEEADPKSDDKIVMHPTDRTARTTSVKNKITGFKVTGASMPSNNLCDKMATIVTKEVIRYVAWEKCTSRDQEVMEEPEIKGLRLTKEGFFQQDVNPDGRTDLSGEFLWDYAMRRRSVAFDIGGLMSYESADLWSETLKEHILKAPPPGYKKVSWSQIRTADEALWTTVQRLCEGAVKAPLGKTETAFETHWKTAMFNYDVRQHLCFLQGSGSSSSASGTGAATTHSEMIKKLENKLKNAAEQIAGQKRRLDYQPTNPGNQKGKKGKGKGKSAKTRRAPANLFPDCMATHNGENVCFSFNQAVGCPLAKAGGKCHKGVHVCIKCHGLHSYSMPCPSI